MEKWRFYTDEARAQIEYAKCAWGAFMNAEERNSVEEMFLHLQHFLSHAAIVDKTLYSKKGSERERVLLGHVDLSGIDLKPFRRLRNHLEHFDERLDDWVSNYDGSPFFDMNIVTGAKGFPKKAFLRALDARTYKFHGEDFDLDELHNILLAIDQKLPR
jgi:hypothetical protein